MSDLPIKYRGYEIDRPTYVPGPQFSWEYAHENYGGEGDGRCGLAASIDACKAEIDERIDEGFDAGYGA